MSSRDRRTSRWRLPEPWGLRRERLQRHGKTSMCGVGECVHTELRGAGGDAASVPPAAACGCAGGQRAFETRPQLTTHLVVLLRRLSAFLARGCLFTGGPGCSLAAPTPAGAAGFMPCGDGVGCSLVAVVHAVCCACQHPLAAQLCSCLWQLHRVGHCLNNAISPRLPRWLLCYHAWGGSVLADANCCSAAHLIRACSHRSSWWWRKRVSVCGYECNGCCCLAALSFRETDCRSLDTHHSISCLCNPVDCLCVCSM